MKGLIQRQIREPKNTAATLNSTMDEAENQMSSIEKTVYSPNSKEIWRGSQDSAVGEVLIWHRFDPCHPIWSPE